MFSVILDKGMAAKHRLPLSHVISTLHQVDYMIREIGQQIQRARGIKNADGDFGIELLANAAGFAFRRGSIATQAELTKDVENGIETIRHVIGTTNIVEAKKEPVSVDEYGAPVLRRLAKIAPMQEADKTELSLQLAIPGMAVESSRFGKHGLSNIRKLTAAELEIEALTVYGKLKKLTDRSITEEEDDIWGQLVEDNGNKWNIKFKAADLKKAQDLFTKQVCVLGDAVYFKTALPRLNVRTIAKDKPRNYISAFNAFGRKYKDVFGDRTPEDILADIRG
jgi:hypothetical protein